MVRDLQKSWDRNVEKLPSHLRDYAHFLSMFAENKERMDSFERNRKKPLNKTNKKIIGVLDRILDAQKNQLKTTQDLKDKSIFSKKAFEGRYKVVYEVTGSYISTGQPFYSKYTLIVDDISDLDNALETISNQCKKSDRKVTSIIPIASYQNMVFRGEN